MQQPGNGGVTRGQWLALAAALLGWMFDGFEQGLFPVVARPALQELLQMSGGEVNDAAVGFWMSMASATFLVGAATGGVVFGWLGDKLGRVRAMSVSILTYSLCSALGGFATAPWQMVSVRFVAALGMGGEWSLGVALVMEVWGGRSRALLAGLIGAAANVGYMLVALLNFGLGSFKATLASWGLPPNWVEWRLLMVCAALPALLTFFIRLFVPESRSWEKERATGTTSSWASRDLLAVLAGALVCVGLLAVWDRLDGWGPRLGAMALTLGLVGCCYLYPIVAYMTRLGEPRAVRAATLRRMLLAALISSVPLLATWGAVQWASAWAHQLGEQAVLAGQHSQADVQFWKEYTQITSGFGAVVGTIGGALLAGWLGRRIVYILLCVVSLLAVRLFYLGNTTFDALFVLTVFLVGVTSAAFYGWLPLYLPELFPTRVRATGQGFGYNFGRIIAAVGVLQVPALMGKPPDYARAGSLLALIYLVGLVVIWLAPETKGQPLPE
jgi:MFS family permease